MSTKTKPATQQTLAPTASAPLDHDDEDAPEPESGEAKKRRWPAAADWKTKDSMRAVAAVEHVLDQVPDTHLALVLGGVGDLVDERQARRARAGKAVG